MRYWSPKKAAAHRIAMDALTQYGPEKVFRAVLSQTSPTAKLPPAINLMAELHPTEDDPMVLSLSSNLDRMAKSSQRMYEYVLSEFLEYLPKQKTGSEGKG
jgi:hypothetical protein